MKFFNIHPNYCRLIYPVLSITNHHYYVQCIYIYMYIDIYTHYIMGINNYSPSLPWVNYHLSSLLFTIVNQSMDHNYYSPSFIVNRYYLTIIIIIIPNHNFNHHSPLLYHHLPSITIIHNYYTIIYHQQPSFTTIIPSFTINNHHSPLLYHHSPSITIIHHYYTIIHHQ